MFKLFKSTNNHQYPLMRDPQRNPKCYEMTLEERLAALKKSDELLTQRVSEQVKNYWGA